MTDRATVFAAVSERLPGVWNLPGTIDHMDAICAAWEAGQDKPKRRLGSLSEKYESGGRGPGTVSTGVGDPGGVSYGLYQLASRKGTVQSFLRNEGARWRNQLSASPGSAAFSAAWKAIAAREPDDFTAAQHEFIKRSHYDPTVAAVLRATHVDLDDRHDAVRDATWSVAVQHGGAASILIPAVEKAADKGDRALVNAIYDERERYVRRVAGRTAKPSERRTLLSVIDNRYPAERRDALAMLEV